MTRLALVLALVWLAGCSDPPADHRQPEPPAAAEVADLRARELAAGVAAAEARAAGDTPRADYHARLAAELGQLRAEADARAATQAAELTRIEADARADAIARAEREQQVRDRRWSLIGLAACAALLVALLWLRVPATIALGVPSALGAGLATLAGLSSVPWLAPALGYGLACLLLIAFAGLAVTVAREWRRHADETQALGRAEADRRSLARQPGWLRPVVTWMLGLPPVAADDHA